MADNFLVEQPNGVWATVAAVDVAGVLTLSVTPAASNSFLLVPQPNGVWIKLATVLTAGVHTICVA